MRQIEEEEKQALEQSLLESERQAQEAAEQALSVEQDRSDQQ